MTNHKWRIFCNTENTWTYGTTESTEVPPTVCFTDINHVVNLNSYRLINEKKITNFSICTDPDNPSGTGSILLEKFLNIKPQTIPTIPETGSISVFVDSTDGQMKLIDSDGVIKSLIQDSNTNTVMVGIMKDVKSAGNDGGDFPKQTWVDRELNTLIGNANSRISLNSNKFTLQAGKYIIDAKSPSYDVDDNLLRLYNITDSSVETYGMVAFSEKGDIATLIHYISISSSKQFKIQHRCEKKKDNYGLGRATGFGTEVYSVVKIDVLE